MIKKEIIATNLQDYYTKLCDLQTKRHGKDYILVHDEIRKLLKECSTYAEFGIMQGATLAAAMLENPKRVHAFDIDLDWYNKGRQHFEEYATNNNIVFDVFETDTADCRIEPTELLYIDSCHTVLHLEKELNQHGSFVKKYIILHDTNSKPELDRVAVTYGKETNRWAVINRCNKNVGFLTLQRLRYDQFGSQ